jgi:hypothetical protein
MPNSLSAQRVQLACHPSTPSSEAVRSVEVRLHRENGAFALVYSLAADLSRLRVPPHQEAQRVDELWKHTCFEAFIATSGAPSYCELNFSPSTQWAAYRFTGYREGMAPLDVEYPRPMRVRSGSHGLELHVAIRPIDTSEPEEDARHRIALAAVIEEADGRISYWALRHPAGKPDFHHPDAFAFEL